VKLGPGGIREIEFFAQTQQLILGGRDPELRCRDTVGALSKLSAKGHTQPQVSDEMISAYRALRHVEHRIQMLQDEQTHTLPKKESLREDVAYLCGLDSLDVFDDAVRQTRQIVHANYLDLFGREARQSQNAIEGNLVFTGVDDDPNTVDTLSNLGFADPSRLIGDIRQWHRGHLPATRTARGRELLTALLPGLLSDMSKTGEPDEAFQRFSVFLARLPSGVQTLAMLLAEEGLRRDVVSTLALAPQLAQTLGRKPYLMEALLQPDQLAGMAVTSDMSFDDAMDGARRHVREQAFLIGFDLLHGRRQARDAGIDYSDLADKTVSAMAQAAEIETARRFGPAPGQWCVTALGKLGGRAMTAKSDLDLMVLYHAPGTEGGSKWFTRFTQRLITALSADTAEGNLYEVDMRLRPSGRAGPVAVSVQSFERYHMSEAWTWEHMALTRLRPIVGSDDLSNEVAELTCDLLAKAPRRDEVTNDVLSMRRRLMREKPGHGLWDMKSGPGGLVDLEFAVQHALLLHEGPYKHVPVIQDAISHLQKTGSFDAAMAVDLKDAYTVLSTLQHLQRLALPGDIVPVDLPSALRRLFARALECGTFAEVETRLLEAKKTVLKIRQERIGSTEGDAGLSF
ncbi:MAG: DUF294 nucleotidyltransferase-like domain-containing protein, partial [Pseudomonadota bacterium]